MITFVKGDFFDYNADIRVNTVNCVGIMGAGVALIFKNKYPQMFEEYVRACNQRLIRPGKPHVWNTPELFGDKLTIINFPTKDDWKKPSEYEYIEKGLKWLRQYLCTRENVTITIPALGCGHGGLDWNIVKIMIEKELENLNINILVFEPASSITKDITNEICDALDKENIKHITSINPKFSFRFKKEKNLDLYVKGNLNVFNKKIISVIIDSKSGEKELKSFFECVDELRDQDIIYMLGLNSSIETDILKGLVIRKLMTIIVLPYGILQLKIRNDLKQIWDNNLITTVSLSHPRQTWKNFEGIKSLKFRINISDVVLINNREIESLKPYEKEFRNSKKVFYINYWNESIDFFSKISAVKIGRNPKTMLPNITPILKDL